MNLLIFDMDGVLIKPQGYHRALKETVRMAGISTGIGEVSLTDGQIARFEALGISSEWHSSALCMAAMTLLKQSRPIQKIGSSKPVFLDLDDLFEAIAAQSMRNPPLNRGVAAIENLATKYGLSAFDASGLVKKSESIHHSVTLKWFQELILGSDVYTNTYQKEALIQTESFLQLFDQKLINGGLADNIISWNAKEDNGASIMTNRPSRGLPGFQGAPDAEMGALLAGLETLPIVGYSEICWLAEESQRDVGELSKPGWAHALSAILSASGWSLEESLFFVSEALSSQHWDKIDHLRDSTITVFEDTPAGLLAVHESAALLNKVGFNLEVNKIGIAEDPIKASALTAQGATVFPNINVAFSNLDNF